jgi:thermitase
MSRSTPAVAAVALLALAACTDAPPSGPDRPSLSAVDASASALADDGVNAWQDDQVIVQFRAGSAPGLAVSAEARLRAAERFAERRGATVMRALRTPNAFVLRVAPGTAAEEAARLAADDDIVIAEPDEPIVVMPCETGTCADPGDFFFGRKWDLHNTGSIINSATNSTVVATTGAAGADVDWLEAFDALGGFGFTGSAVVGIVDTGIRQQHVDLVGKVIAAQNFATGYAPTLIEDRDSHGTHVAGIAASSGTVGAPGIAWGANVKLVNAKACERYIFPDGVIRTSCPTSSTSDAIRWAADQGANVINLSLGGSPAATSGSAIQQAALQYAQGKGVLAFCATGNDNYAGIAFPARFPECVAVGATSWSDTRASYSNYGSDIELSAPGGDGGSGFPYNLIMSLSNNAGNNFYSYKAGTSMATPQVAGLAALLVASGVSASDVVARMKETADDLGPAGFDVEYGTGRINVCRALDPYALRVSMPGAVNMKDGTSGTFPVVLFGSDRFVAEQFSAANLTLGDGSGAETAVSVKNDDYRATLVDVDLDGRLDIALKFSREELFANGDLKPGRSRLQLRGSIGCRRVMGESSVKTT